MKVDKAFKWKDVLLIKKEWCSTNGWGLRFYCKKSKTILNRSESLSQWNSTFHKDMETALDNLFEITVLK